MNLRDRLSRALGQQSSSTLQRRPKPAPASSRPPASPVARKSSGGAAPNRGSATPASADAAKKGMRETLFTWVDDIASADGGSVAFPKALQQRALYFAARRVFLLSATEPKHALVSEARALVRRSGHEIKQELLCDITVIAELYRELEKRKGEVDYRTRTNTTGATGGMDVEGPALEFLRLLDRAARSRCSDVQIIRRHETTQVERIIDGEISPDGGYTAEWGHRIIHAVAANCEIAGGGDRRSDRHQEGSLSRGQGWNLPLGVEGVRLQFNVLTDGEALVARLFYATSDVNEDVDVVDLGYLGFQGEMIERGYHAPYGVVLMAGPTNSGKSTTIRTILRMINKENNGRYNILTVENPAEVPIPGAKALKVMNTHGGLEENHQAYVDAQTATLRSAPRVLFFGEGRNKREIDALITGARTGHLCLSTIHANTAITTIQRMLNEGVSRTDLVNPTMIRLLIGQRLLPGACPSCRVPFHRLASTHPQAVARVEKAFRYAPDLLDNVYFRNPDPGDCPSCGGRGRKGMKVAAEVVAPTTALLETCLEKGVPYAQELWMDTMDGFSLAEHGVYHLVHGSVGIQDLEDRMGQLAEIPEARISRLRQVIQAEQDRLTAMTGGVSLAIIQR